MMDTIKSLLLLPFVLIMAYWPWIAGILTVVWIIDFACGFCIYGPPLPDRSGDWGR